jgi:hypothetical protein
MLSQLESAAKIGQVRPPVRLRVCFHDNCFDGASSAALFTRFYRDRVRADAEILYRGMAHGPGPVFPEGTFDGDENAVVDFRYSPDPRLTWWFDHHVSAFQEPGDEAHFRAQASSRQFFDPTAKSCAKFLARTVAEKFGWDTARHRELIEWAEIVDGALFESAESAVRLAEPALRLMTWIENNKEPPLTERFIGELVAARPLAAIAAEPWVTGPLEPVLAAHAKAVDVLKARSRLEGGVVRFDVTDEGLTAYNKFIPYYLFPQARFVVGLSRPGPRLKISVGSNPWLPRPAVSIAKICERYGGGGHPVVGAVSLPADQLARAREVAGEIAEELARSA